MSTTGTDNTVKTSYKSAVAFVDDISSCNQIDATFNEYDNLESIKPLVAKDMLIRRNKKNVRTTQSLPLPMKYFMSDIIEPLGDLTHEIKELYELKGIANTLKLSDVLNAVEASVHVTYLGDIDVVEPSLSDEEIVQTIK